MSKFEITTRQTSDNKTAVSFPFALKDDFRSKFPSAKWDASRKEWVVGSRSVKRLDQWIEEINKSEVLDDLNAMEEQELSAKELSETQSALEKIKTDIRKKRGEIENLDAAIAKKKEAEKLIVEQKEVLAAVAKQVQVRNDEAETKKAAIKEKLEGIIDFDVINDAISTMKRYHNQVGSPASGQFRDAQEDIKEEIDTLRAAGLESVGLNKLYKINFNRPDRDKVGIVTMDDILTVKKYEEEN